MHKILEKINNNPNFKIFNTNFKCYPNLISPSTPQIQIILQTHRNKWKFKKNPSLFKNSGTLINK